MAKYRAIVSVEFDDDDLQSLADEVGTDRIDPHEFVHGELDSLPVATGWVEQLFVDGEPTMMRLSGGIDVQVNPHEDPTPPA